MPPDRFLIRWEGVAHRHIPADSPFGVTDFRFAGRAADNRWNHRGEPTLYLASDRGVLVAEFARHFREDRTLALASHSQSRRIFDLTLRLSALLDLRDPDLCAALSLRDAPTCFLDRVVSRATAAFLRATTPARGLLVPSMAFLDDPTRWVMALFLDKLPADLGAYITQAVEDGTFRIDP